MVQKQARVPGLVVEERKRVFEAEMAGSERWSPSFLYEEGTTAATEALHRHGFASRVRKTAPSTTAVERKSEHVVGQ
jgi:hypothetical protein